MKIEERLERVRSILEKNNMLEGLQVFSDKQLDEAEEKFNFTFPEELRWVLKIIGVGGNNPLVIAYNYTLIFLELFFDIVSTEMDGNVKVARFVLAR